MMMHSGPARVFDREEDALEAIFGAAYLDSGFDNCRELILSLYNIALETVKGETVLKDPKTRLQEYLQSKQMPLPEYQVEKD